jgi:predicted lipoprotein with Yx(FWY)xxD motif
MHLLRTLGFLTPAALAVTIAVGSGSAGAAASTHVQVRSGSLGHYLVDGRGRALYLFEKDRHGASTCFGGCAAIWPPLLAKGGVARSAGVSAAKLGTVARRGGGRQVTYAGHPLYYYVTDRKPGQVTCQDVTEFGGTWLVVAPSGRAIA